VLGLATGTTAAVPPVLGLAEALPWTSRDVTNLHEVPRRVAIIGGGVAACESATWLRGLGAEEVTLIESAPVLLGRQEPFASEMVARRFEQLGITVLTSTLIDRVERESPVGRGEGHIHGGPVTIHAGDRRIEADEVVVAAGRTPTSSDLGLDTVGIDPTANHGFVAVDDHLAVVDVAGEWLYAIGDLCGRALLTHMGKYQGRIAGDVIAARAEERTLEGLRFQDVADHDMVPAVVFSDPQIASVGLTELAARQRGIDLEVLDFDIGAVAGAALLREGYEGHARLVVDRGTDTLVGATFVGYDVAELLHSATTAIVGKVPLDTLWHVVPSYPTISEVWLRLLESRR
jgi:dihydrolipoamide dehydrogenase